MIISTDQYILSLYISVHVIISMQVLNSWADVSEVPANESFAELTVAEFDFFVERSPRSILENHVSYVSLFFVVVILELDDVGMVEFVMHVDLFLGVFVVYLHKSVDTIFMATTSLF